MYKKVIIIVVIMITGFLAGYFSEPVLQFAAGLEFPKLKPGKIPWFSDNKRNDYRRSASDSAADAVAPVSGSITADAAINAVKALPAVRQLFAAATARGGQVTFRADQPPTSEYPVWLVELRQVYPNQIPDISFLKVDSSSGKVLDIQKEELQIAGFKLSSPLPSGSGAGRRLQTQYVYNDILKRKIRLDRYKGFDVESDRVKGVLRVSVTGAGVKGPRELAAGVTAGDVVKKFGKANIAQGELLIYNAIDDNHLQLHIKLAKERVASFALVKITY